MKISNDFGNKVKGSIGKQVTGSEWKGRNYLKAYSEPANPRSVAQQEKRDWMAEGMEKWQSFNDRQKEAYVVHEKYFGENISATNSFLRVFLDGKQAGLTYFDPPYGNPRTTTQLPFQGCPNVKIQWFQWGKTTPYKEGYSDANGYFPHAITREDEYYWMYLTKDGYYPHTTWQLSAQMVVEQNRAMQPIPPPP